MRRLLLFIGLGLALFLLAPLAGTDIVSGQETLTLNLGPGRDANQTPGTVTLTAEDNQTRVVINMTPGPAGVGQPAHIHVGLCPGVGNIAFPLTNVVNGASTTLVNGTLASLRDGNHSINVHKSESEFGVYVACVNIPAAVAPAPPPPAPAPAPPPAPPPAPAPVSAPRTGGSPPAGDSGFPWWYAALSGGLLLAGGALVASRWRHRSAHN